MSLISRFKLPMALLVVGASAVSAQARNTGSNYTGIAGNTDAFWTVSWTQNNGTGSPFSSGTYAAFIPAANTIPDQAPNGPWQADQGAGVGVTNWISAWTTGATSGIQTTPNGLSSGFKTQTNEANYSYLFTMGGSVTVSGVYSMEIGWDDRLTALKVNGTTVVTNSLPGFCRGDGAFPASGYPNNCTLQVSRFFNVGDKLTVETVGDGTTDALWLSFDNGGNPTALSPEPMTMTLMATGLVGLAGAQIRRRRKNQK